MSTKPGSESGIGIVELFLGSSVLAVAVLGTVSGLMTSMKLAIDTKQANLANDDALAVVEEFRDAAQSGFDAALSAYNDRVRYTDKEGKKTTLNGSSQPQPSNAKRHVVSNVILDETRFTPPVDLNGDGDFSDANLQPSEVRAAYLETTVRWGKDKSMTFVTLVARPTQSGSSTQENSSTGNSTGGSESGTPNGATVSVADSEIKGEKIELTLDNEGSPVQIIGVTLAGSETTHYVKEIKVEGDKVFSNDENAIPTGTMVATTPFTLASGETEIDHIKCQKASNGGGKSNLEGSSYTITFHHEGGGTTVVHVN